jgi:hypothetical protein
MSPMDIYRDSLAALRGRVEELDSQVAHLRARFTAPLWDHLPADVAGRLLELERASATRSDDRDGLHRAIALLESYRRTLDEAIGLAARIERELAHLPGDAPSLEPESFRGVVPGLADRADEIVREIWRELKRIDPECSVHAVRGSRLFSPTHFKARFRAEGCPFSLLLEPTGEETMHATLATAVSRAAPRLQVFPRSVLHTLLRAVRLLHPVRTGDPAFDRRFTVEADVAVARQALSPRLRLLLLELSEAARVTLIVRDNAATCCWDDVFDLATVRRAAHMLAALRLAPTRSDLLRRGR